MFLMEIEMGTCRNRVHCICQACWEDTLRCWLCRAYPEEMNLFVKPRETIETIESTASSLSSST